MALTQTQSIILEKELLVKELNDLKFVYKNLDICFSPLYFKHV